MKYTNYILNGDFDIDSMLSDKNGIRQATILLSIPVAFAGIIVLTGALPFTVIADGERYARLRYYKYLKARRKEQQVMRLLKSFSLNKQQKNNIKSLLTSF